MRKIEKAFVFDFDDTLAFTNAKVHVLSPCRSQVLKCLTPQEFNTHKLNAGESFDFSDFDRSSFILNGTPSKLIDLAKEVCAEGHSVFILTARTNCVASAISEFLNIHGVTASEVHCVGSNNGGDIAKAKRKVLLSIIENFDRVWFFDDDDRNIELASNLPLKAKKV
jgi:hydroxymethylpyrimidine pyrophosphatase-like HAD family hydrolase